MAFRVGSDGKESARSVGDSSSIPGLGRSPGEGHGNPLQYSSLDNLVDRGAWWAMVHRAAQSRTGLKQRSTLIHPATMSCFFYGCIFLLL